MASSEHTVGFEPADRLAQDRESVRRRFWSKLKRVAARLPFARRTVSEAKLDCFRCLSQGVRGCEDEDEAEKDCK